MAGYQHYQSDREQYTPFIPFVKAVGRGEKLKRDLTYEEASEALTMILEGRPTLAQLGAFLISQRVKGESVDEVRAFTDVVRNRFMYRITPAVDGLLDLATPHDGKAKTAQLAPAVALTLVAAGVPVLLHGDEGVATKEGITSSMVLRGLGIAADDAPDDVQKMIETTGFGYASMAQFAPAWHSLLPIRLEFGLRTVFNTVEKFFNPGNAPYQVSGFFHANYIERIRGCQTGEKASWMAQGEEGSVELAIGRKSRIFAAVPAHDVVIEPAATGLGMERVRLEMPKELSAHIAVNRAVLDGTADTDVLNQIALTTGAILHLLGRAPTINDGIASTQTLLSNGSVSAVFRDMVAYCASS